MNIDSIKSFLAIVEAKSISKAAQARNISQSALSQQMKTMERDLGTPLFKRSNTGVTPTASGQIVRRYAQVMAETYNQMIDELTLASGTDKRLKICASANIYTYALPCTMFHLKAKYMDFALEMEQAQSHVAEELILKERVDIAFINGRPASKGLKYRKIYSDAMCLVAAWESNIPESIALKQLYRHPLIMLPSSYRTRKLLDEYLIMIGLDCNRLKILYEMTSTESIKMAVSNDYGIAFVPYMAIKKELYNKQLRMVKLENFDMVNEYYSIRKKNTDLHTNDQIKLMNYLERILQDTIC